MNITSIDYKKYTYMVISDRKQPWGREIRTAIYIGKEHLKTTLIKAEPDDDPKGRVENYLDRFDVKEKKRQKAAADKAAANKAENDRVTAIRAAKRRV